MKRLNVLGSVLYVGAHPDDENTRLLAFFSKERQYRTGYLSLTRGDGGQNLIGNEQGVELGLIRTQELLAARRVDGAEQFFSRAFDFGFSKSTAEALKFWDKNKILSDVVWVIRRFQPDVIITRFPQDNRAGHGHHSASALLAVEAFTAAADSTKFPEQLSYVKTWKAKRVLWNTFNFGTTNTQSDTQTRVEVGTFNPILAKGYGEIAAESRSQHKSQGFGSARQRGTATEFFTIWKGERFKTDPMEGVDVSWNRVKGGAAIRQKIDSIISNYSLFAPGRSVRALVELYNTVSSLEDEYWRVRKQQEILELIVACCGLWSEVTSSENLAIQNDSIPVTFLLNNQNGNKVIIKKISLANVDTLINTPLASNKNFIINKKLFIPDTASISQPYWLKYPMKSGSFDVRDQTVIGNADNEASLVSRFLVNIEGQDFELIRPLQQKYTDPVKGELYQPVVIVPPVLVAPEKTLLISATPEPQTIHFSVKALKNIPAPTVTITDNKEWRAEPPQSKNKDSLKKGSENDFTVVINPVLSERKAGYQELTGVASESGRQFALALKSIHYDHIPQISYFRAPAVDILTLDIKILGKKIGYIEGAGDYVPAALIQMGYEVTLLNDNNLNNTDLSQFDAIITGVRAYNIKESLNTYYDKLMRYVENGGNMIVQYNTSTQIGPVKAKIGPYPFEISRTRVSDENARVKVLKPDHPIMTFPNKLTTKDFEGWVQERSIYHANKWDNRYQTIFTMHDPEEKDDEGSLIFTNYGKGTFVYTGLVFYRELPAGVSGAYRLLANLIALNHKKGF
ncbi:MAG TPA: PIG-L family deacetylase [Chitinophagaceae bacterium]|nr:PIG-L family deacetylase [Chitinophagaceae bacterium]